MSKTSMEITIALAIPALIVIVYIWANGLQNTPYLAVIFFALFPVLVSAIITAIQLYREKFVKKDASAKQDEDPHVQRFIREKEEILQLVEKISQEVKQQGSEEKQLDLESKKIELARERLELAKQYSDFEKSRAHNAAEVMCQFAQTLPAHGDEKMRETMVSLLAQLFSQPDLGRLDPLLQNQLKEA